MGGLPLAKSPVTVQTGGEGRYRYRNVKEAVTPYLRVASFAQPFSYSDSSRVLSARLL